MLLIKFLEMANSTQLYALLLLKKKNYAMLSLSDSFFKQILFISFII